MLETVLFGEPDRLLQKRAELIEYVGMAFSKLGIKGSFETASDAFFLPEDAGAKLMQQLKGTKLEYQVHLGKKNVALASLNYHENHFTAAFSIGTETTHSMCVAFGIERLAAHSLSVWGNDQAYWPIC